MDVKQFHSAMDTDKKDARPSCGYTVVTKKTDDKGNTSSERKKCGSEERLYSVEGRGTWGAKKVTPVCGKHVEKAYRDWNVDEVRPIDLASGKR